MRRNLENENFNYCQYTFQFFKCGNTRAEKLCSGEISFLTNVLEIYEDAKFKGMQRPHKNKAKFMPGNL